MCKQEKKSSPFQWRNRSRYEWKKYLIQGNNFYVWEVSRRLLLLIYPFRMLFSKTVLGGYMLMHRFFKLTNVAFYSLNSHLYLIHRFFWGRQRLHSKWYLKWWRIVGRNVHQITIKTKKMDKGWGESPQIWI